MKLIFIRRKYFCLNYVLRKYHCNYRPVIKYKVYYALKKEVIHIFLKILNDGTKIIDKGICKYSFLKEKI